MHNQKNICCSVMLHNLSSEELSVCFTALHQAIDSLKCDLSKKDREVYLTRQEVAEMLKCDISTVHNWSKAGKLRGYGVGNRVYYKLSEVESMMVPLFNKRKKL